MTAVPVRPYEVGGWLLGYWGEGDESVFITNATPPSRGTPFGVTISGRRHRRRFDEAWDASEGLVTFLGDWHTHPASPPVPSRRDLRALDRLARDPDYGAPRPIIAIVSTARWPWREVEPALAFYMREPDGDVRSLKPRVEDALPEAAALVPAWPWPKARPEAQLETDSQRASRCRKGVRDRPKL